MGKLPIHMKCVFLFFLLATTNNTWIEQFRTFRDGLYHRDKEIVKQFFNFPLEGNIWEFAMMDGPGTDKATYNALQNLAKHYSPLTEKRFDLYFDHLFPKEYVSSLLKINTKELYEKGKTQTPELSDDKIHFYKLLAEFDKREQILTLHLLLYIKTKPTDEDSPGGGYGENVLIQFSLIKGKLKFINLSMAG